jgi:hypothetical protein
MLRFLLWLCAAYALAAAPVAAAPQPQAQAASPFARSGDRVTFTAARISFPAQAGAVRLEDTSEFSHQGEGVDNGIQYVSPDRQVFATVYIYYPGLSHAGLTAFMTDLAIAQQSSNLTRRGSHVVGAGGRDGVAIRSDYAGFRDGMASSAAFMKAGRWIVKIRVSGPNGRAADVEGAMTALLAALRFEGELQPRAAAPLEVADCEAPAAPPARMVNIDAAEAMALTLIGTFDAGGDEPRDNQGNRLAPVAARMATRWCQSTLLNIGNSRYPVLRAGGGAPAGEYGRSELIVPINDAGTALELVRLADRGRFVLLYHEIGRTSVLGTYDGPLSDEQLAGILNGSDREGTRIRASVDHLPNGDTNINLQELPSEPRRGT